MDPNLHPDGAEIHDYVAIGPSPDLSVSVHKDTFDKMFIIATIIGGLVLLAVVVITVIFALRAGQLPPPPPPLPPSPDTTAQTNFGSAAKATYPISTSLPEASELDVCTPDHHADMHDGECRCIPPFFGPDCSLERHHKRYFSVGTPNEDTLHMTILDEVVSNGKSFNQNTGTDSCSNWCDRTDTCIGFIYHETNQCTLLGDNVVVPAGETIAYHPEENSTLYLRDSRNLHFEHKVFLGEYNWSLPPRYWLLNEAPGYLQVPMRIVRKLKFYPEYVLAHGSYVGIYSPESFTSDMIPEILKLGNTPQSHIHLPNTMLNLPPHWKYKRALYVAYVPVV